MTCEEGVTLVILIKKLQRSIVLYQIHSSVVDYKTDTLFNAMNPKPRASVINSCVLQIGTQVTQMLHL